MKRCLKCGKLKHESEFPKDRTRKDGLHQRCKVCKNAYNRKRYSAKQQVQKVKSDSVSKKRCSNCGKLKARSEYSKDRTKKDGLYHLCKVCRSEYRCKNKGAKRSSNIGNAEAETVNLDNTNVSVLAGVNSGEECGVCSICGQSLKGYISGYLQGQPVCKDCVIINLKSMFKKRPLRK